MARVSRKRKQEQAVEKLAVSRDEVYQCAVYIRLSKEENEKSDSHKLDNQEQVILNYVRKNSDLKIVKIYCDNGYSGTNFSRAAFGEMMQDIKSGIIRCVIVKDLSRLGRNHIETEQYIRTVFPFFNVRFIAVNDHFDSLHPEGDLMASLKNIINDAYAKDISRKIFTVKQNQRLKGEFVGNIPPYGYEKSVEDGHKLVINEETAPVIRKIFQLKEQKKTNTEIAKILEEEREIAPMTYWYRKGKVHHEKYAHRTWEATTIKTILANQMYTGDMVQGKKQKCIAEGRNTQKKQKEEDYVIVPNTHEALIDRSLFDKVQKICREELEANREKRKKQNKKSGLILMWISVAVSLSFLLIFKYADFLIENVNQLPGVSLPLSKLSLPIGISFYTFQIISYTVDVWRGDTKAQRNIISFGTYVSLFPQLIAGPIVRYTDIERELQERKHSVTLAASGIQRFLIGLSKKVLIANVLGELTDICLKTSQPSILSWWMYAVALVLQIYFDFSGYSDMAIGLGRIFGFRFPENFNYPLISRSVKEFWRRWHISLSSWFRDYVYIPLGGSRVKTGLYVRNVIAVWMLTGLWHGASWNFVVWGVGFGVLLLCERFLWGKWLERMPSIISHLYLLFIILLSFILFSADTIPQAMQRIGGLFGAGKLPVISVQSVYYLRSYGLLLIFAAIAATPLPVTAFNRFMKTKAGSILNWVMPIVLIGLFLLATAFLVDGSYNPFLYFRF